MENYKQLSQDLSSGKNLLLDYNNNEIECTKYGIKKPKYSRNITGQSSFQNRFKKGLVNKIKYDPTQYLPITSRLNGSPMYPSPISIPFYNQENNKEKSLLDEIRKEAFYNISKNKKLFLMEKNKNNLPNYFCTKLAVDSPKNRKRLINLFNSEIENRKKKYRYQAKYYKKDSIFRGLDHQKNCMENNLTKDLFNGEKIPFTTQKDINIKFKVVKRLIVKNGFKKMHIENEEVNKEEYNKLYKIKRMQSLSAPRGNLLNIKQKSRQKVVSNNFDTSVALSNDPKCTSIQNTLNKSVKFNSTITTCYNYNFENNLTNNESKISKNMTTKNELYSPKSLHKLKRTLSDFPPNIINKFNMKEEVS